MLHVRHGSHVKINRDELNESYMMHGSTSPQYSMIASLDVATKMMDDSGEILMSDTIMEAVLLRQKVSKIFKGMKADNDWFFEMWQPQKVDFNGEVKLEQMITGMVLIILKIPMQC